MWFFHIPGVCFTDKAAPFSRGSVPWSVSAPDGSNYRRAGLDVIEFAPMTVKILLRGKEYEVKPGMTLLDSLKKINVLPESVLAVRNGEMIVEDEILKDGDVVKLVAVISGGAQ